MTIRILTDSTAIFSSPTFSGHALVKVAPIEAQLSHSPEAASRMMGEFSRELTGLDHTCDHILMIVSSSGLGPVAESAEQAARQHGGHAKVVVIDTQNIGAGLGLLVELSARAALQGASALEVERMARNAISKIYTLICVPELDYLAKSGYLTKSQAEAARVLGIMPIFMLEEGLLSPMAKVRTPRHMFESFQEFLEEFSDPGHVVLVKGQNPRLRTRPLRQFVQENFPASAYNECPLSPAVASYFGSQALGLTVMDAG